MALFYIDTCECLLVKSQRYAYFFQEKCLRKKQILGITNEYIIGCTVLKGNSNYLPPYCPEMNPTELLNQDLKANAFKHKIIRSQDELEIATRVYLGNIQFDEFKVRSFFTPKPVEYINQTYSSSCMAG